MPGTGEGSGATDEQAVSVKEMPTKEEKLKAERWLKSIRDEAAAKRGRGQKTSGVMEAL
jgi:hypothetical protein